MPSRKLKITTTSQDNLHATSWKQLPESVFYTFKSVPRERLHCYQVTQRRFWAEIKFLLVFDRY